MLTSFDRQSTRRVPLTLVSTSVFPFTVMVTVVALGVTINIGWLTTSPLLLTVPADVIKIIPSEDGSFSGWQ